jgi:hypothetical protein
VVGQPAGHRLGLVDVGRLDHHPHQRLGAGRPQQHPPGAAQLALRLVHGAGQLGGGRDPRLVDVAHVDQHLRQPLHHGGQLTQRPAARRDPGRQQQAGERAVAGGRVVQRDHVAGLLAAQREALLLHLLQHVAVADRRLDEVDALALHGQLEAQVGHHGGDHGVGAQHAPLPHRQREDGQDLVPVDLLARVVDRQAPVGVAVVRDAEVGAVLQDRRLDLVEVGGPVAVVDVEAVRVGTDGDHPGTGPLEGDRGDPGGRAVRLVEHHRQAVEPVGKDTEQVGDVGLQTLQVLADPADARAGRPVPEGARAVLAVDGLDAVLELVGQLVTATGEELDAVVGHGVVARGEHHAQVGAEYSGQVRDRRGGQHAHLEHVHARTGEAGHHGRLQELSGRARVPSDDRLGAMPLEGARLGQYVRRRHGETERELGRQVRVGDTPYTVGAEESSHWSSREVLHQKCCVTGAATSRTPRPGPYEPYSTLFPYMTVAADKRTPRRHQRSAAGAFGRTAGLPYVQAAPD